MKAEGLNKALIRRFPVLLEAYLEVKRLWGGAEPGPHIVYGDVLVPFIRTALAAETSASHLPAVVQFLEEMSETADGDTLDVLVTSVLEPLLDDRHRSRLQGCMGPRTLKLWERLLAGAG